MGTIFFTFFISRATGRGARRETGAVGDDERLGFGLAAIEMLASGRRMPNLRELVPVALVPGGDFELVPGEKLAISGGGPYAIRLPAGGVDARVRHAPEDLDLVPYLRNAFNWGGLPGLALEDSLAPEMARLVERLSRGLEPF